MTKSKPREHAEHNYQACLYLKNTSHFNDWVITTAFYSALHFATDLLFPAQYDANGKVKNYYSINEYYGACRGRYKSLHECRIKMVEEHLPEIIDEYEMLYDLSSTARYVNYAHDEDITKKAYDNLVIIRDYR